MGAPDRLTCEEMFRRLEDYVDRELHEDELRRAEEHLQTCSSCLAEYRFEKGVVEAISWLAIMGAISLSSQPRGTSTSLFSKTKWPLAALAA